MFKRFKNCLTSNIISLLGYLIFISTVIFLFIIYPYCLTIDNGYKGMHTVAGISSFIAFFILLIFYLIVFLLFILYFLEQYLLKIGKIKPLKFLENFDKRKTKLFWLGYILIPFPIYLIFLYSIFMFFGIILLTSAIYLDYSMP